VSVKKFVAYFLQLTVVKSVHDFCRFELINIIIFEISIFLRFRMKELYGICICSNYPKNILL